MEGTTPLPDGLPPRYLPRRILGQGGFGRVILAQDLELGRLVAVKVLRCEGGDAEFRARFRREARLTASLEHPHFLGKLAALIPIPRMHTIRFQGVFSAHARLRPEVVPKGERDLATCEHGLEATDSLDGAWPRRASWSKLLARVFQVDVLECPRCESRMQAIAAICDPSAIQAILRAVGMPTDSPELGSVRREEQALFPAA